MTLPMNGLHATSLLLCLGLAACSSGKKAESEPVEPVEWPEAQPLEGDRSVEEHLEMLMVGSQRRLGRKEITLSVRNTSNERLEFVYALEWKDRRGQIIGGYHYDWTPLALDSGESTVLTIQGPTPAAETWRFHAERRDPNSEAAEAPSN